VAKRKKAAHRDRVHHRRTGESGTIIDTHTPKDGPPVYSVIPDTGPRRTRIWSSADADWEPPPPGRAHCHRCDADDHTVINCPNGDCGYPPSILFTGRNTVEVRDWVNRDAGRDMTESWFITRGMSAATGGQAWNYVRDGRKWGEDVRACVYDPRSERWEPVRPGDYIEKQGDGYGVRSPK